jgi:tripartite-type tricarboxylate transporter receptor subunit TctC
MKRRQFLRLTAAAAAGLAAPVMASAQTYHARPVRAVVAFAPGGTTDTFARVMAQKLSETLGKQFYVENIAGATGNIGTGQVAKAAPDGYTILFAFSSYVVNPTLFDKIPYDPIKDFDPVSLAVTSTSVLTVHPSVPATTVKDLVGLIKASSGKYSFSSAGPAPVASRGRAAPAAARSTSCMCPTTAAAWRSSGRRRPHADWFHVAGGRGSADQARQRARARDHQREALADPGRRADFCRGRLPRDRER